MIQKDFRGCILASKNHEIILQHTEGFRDLPNKIDNQIYTKFPTASAGKVFVAVGILQLIEKGKLCLDDTIGELLTIDLKDIDPSITVKQLLTHFSGIPDYFDESVMDEYEELWVDYPNYKVRTSSDLLPLFINKPMLYTPGEKFQYNNTGFVVLGLIIESITKMSFDEYLEKNVFEPASMKDTGYYELDRLPANCANAYIYDSATEDYRTNIFSVDVKGTGAGGAFTTVVDVNNFWKSLLAGKLISKDILADMLSPKGVPYYGYGIWLRKLNDESYRPYFQGEDPGVSFVSYYDLETDIHVTAVSNYCDDVWTVAKEILESLIAE